MDFTVWERPGEGDSLGLVPGVNKLDENPGFLSRGFH